MTNRAASAVMLGFNFEINAAIVLMLENIDDLASIRTEGHFEDIDIKLNDGSWIFAQAKAVQMANSDFKNVRRNLEKSLTSLSEAEKKAKSPIKKLIMITNSINPLNSIPTMNIFYGHAHTDYSMMPDNAKKIIDEIIKKAKIDIDLSLFRIQVVPFVGDDYYERYKVVREVIKAFLGKLNVQNTNTEQLTDDLLKVWHFEIMDNGSTKNEEITISKESIVWPLIALLTDVNNSDSLRDEFEPGTYDEIITRYRQIINHKCEKFEFVTRILHDYRNYSFSGTEKERTNSFLAQEWQQYIQDFQLPDIEDELLEQIIKITIGSILNQKFAINRIKVGVGL